MILQSLAETPDGEFTLEEDKMTEEQKPQGQEQPQMKRPEEIPMEQRFATLMVVWTKEGQILTAYPKETHIATKMLSVALDAVATNELEQAKGRQAAQAAAERLAQDLEKKIVPAAAMPSFDPRFLKKN